LLAAPGIYGVLSDAFDASDDSKEALDDAVLQTRSLQRAAASFPESREIQLALATAYSHEASDWNHRRDLRTAADTYRQAISLRERLLTQDPSDVLTRRLLMISYGNMGGNLGHPFYANLGDTAGAREAYGKALDIARDLAKSDATDQLAQYDLANALMFYASMNLPKEEWPSALALLREAEAIMQKLTLADPQSVAKLRTLAGIQEYEGRRLAGLGRLEEAVSQLRQSLAAAEKAVAKNPSGLPQISQTLATEEALAGALVQAGQGTAALDIAQKAVFRAEHVSAPESERLHLKSFIAAAYGSLADVQASLGRWSAARIAAERAVAEWRDIAAQGGAYLNRPEATRAESLLQEAVAHVQ